MLRERWVVGMTVGLASAALACGDYAPEGEFKRLLEEHARREVAGEPPEALAALEARIDALAGARDAAFSGLRWERDLARARRVAAAEGKPVLSLRLLGELTSELSCANSRFFRVALYADPGLADLLRERVVLHWESVRPAPRITVDLGDGRRIERTIAGNSIHYVLLPDGTVVDALPGLYGPGAFADALLPALEVASAALALPAEARAAALAHHHEATYARLTRAAMQAAAQRREAGRGAPGRPTAAQAAPLAMGKAMVERPLLGALGQTPAPDDPAWDEIAARYAARCRLSPRARALLARKVPAERRDARGLGQVVARFEAVCARDSAQNELRLRPSILAWLRTGAGADLAALNRRVYAELFRTPDDDPWLGLAPGDVFAAIDGGGLAGP